ncbi:MAG: cyclopropane fatty-acyl-phospholipid synthase-like methyltransferase [Phenylobacterium sp.]|jgi:cyclopropane fatty-acyl-phospholipid synthase-like methyltransferase
MTNPLPQDVAQLYDAPAGQGGHVVFDGQFHWGYWDDQNPEDSLSEAADRLTQIMIDKTTIKANQRFVDLGCGVGVPAMRLAKAKDCLVDAVTISEYQHGQATQRITQADMSEQVTCIHGNALEMPCEAQTYDGGWFFETIFHMGHKEALKEASRILKPGALLLIADLPTRADIDEEFKVFAKDKIHSVFIAKEDYTDLLDEAGFDLIEIDDITEFVIPPLVPKIKEAYAQHKSEVLTYVDEDSIPRWVQMFEDMCNNLGYMLVTARKRG